MTAQTSKPAYIRGRSCRNCTGPIPKPKGNNVKKKIFCCDNCRKEFHKTNGVSTHKLKAMVQKWVAEAQAEAIESRIRLLVKPGALRA